MTSFSPAACGASAHTPLTAIHKNQPTMLADLRNLHPRFRSRLMAPVVRRSTWISRGPQLALGLVGPGHVQHPQLIQDPVQQPLFFWRQVSSALDPQQIEHVDLDARSI